MIEELQRMKADLDNYAKAIKLRHHTLGERIDILDTQLTTEIERLEARTSDKQQDLRNALTTGMVANAAKAAKDSDAYHDSTSKLIAEMDARLIERIDLLEQSASDARIAERDLVTAELAALAERVDELDQVK